MQVVTECCLPTQRAESRHGSHSVITQIHIKCFTSHFFPASESPKTGLATRLGIQASLCPREPLCLVYANREQRGQA